MCSIFGFIARKSSPVDLRIVRNIVEANIERGPHAFGFAWIDSRDRLHAFKQRGRLTDMLGILAMARDARMMIGHLRYATHGEPSNNINNHPHPVDGGWLVHNGVVRNYDELLEEHSVCPMSECDSEVLAHLIERSEESKYVRRAAESVEQTDGALAMLSLWARPNKMVAVRRGNPLHFGYTTAGLYIATLAKGLPGKLHSVTDNFAVELNAIGQTTRAIQLEDRDDAVATLYDRNTYRGG